MQVFIGNCGFRRAGALLLAETGGSSKIFWLFSRHRICPCHFPPAICPADHGGAHAARVASFSSPSRGRLRAFSKNRRRIPSGLQLLLSSRENCVSRPPPSAAPSRGQVPYWVKSRFAESPESSSRESTAGGSSSLLLERRLLEQQPLARRPVAQPGVGPTRGSLQGGRGGRILKLQSASFPLAELVLVAEARPAAAAGRGRARGSRQGCGCRTCAGQAAGAGSSPCSVGDEGPGAGAGAGAAPEGHLLPPRPPLEDVSGKAHVLPAGAEQDDLGGARALPEPVPGGLRRLWLSVVSVTGSGAVVAGWPLCPGARPVPAAQRCTKRQEFSLGEGMAAPSTLVRRLCPLHLSPCTPGWVVIRVQDAGPRWAAGGGAGAPPWLAP